MFKGLLARRVSLEPGLAARLRNWRALPEPNPERPLAHTRWVIVDVESSGLDPGRDRLIAIGAVAVHGESVRLEDGFEVILRQETASDTANILVHGIGMEAQAGGVAPAQALLNFLHFVGKDPLVAFHAPFDEEMLSRALHLHLGLRFVRPWFDLARLLPAVFPEMAARHKSLDDWLGQFAIPNFARHNAVADSFATAQLCLVLLQRAKARRVENRAQLRKIERDHRRLSRAGHWAF